MNKDIFPKPDKIMSMASAFYESCVLFAACDLGIFTELSKKGKADAKTIASSLNLDERGTKLLLNACAAVGLLLKEEDKYCNTPEAAMFLTQGSFADLSGAIRYNRDVYNAWGRLTSMVKTGKPVEKPELHLGMDHERTRTFVMSMHFRALGIGKALISKLDLNSGGIVNVMDMMTDSTCINPRFSALFAVNMALTAESGWVFSDSELKNWIIKAGFSDFSVKPLPAPMPHWLATARKK